MQSLSKAVKNLTPDQRQLYIALKPLVPEYEQQDFRDAFLTFQDTDMMELFRERYL